MPLLMDSLIGRSIRGLCFVLLSSALSLSSSGCTLLGFAAYAMPRPDVQPKYTGMTGQTVGVMVWADRGIRIDWPTVQLDLANAIQKKLSNEATKKDPPKVLKGTTFPVQAASIVRYQKDHPEIDARPITEIAPRLGVSRLIYVELEDFATRSDMSVDLFRGTANATIRVLEIDGGVAKVGFEQNNVRAAFPQKAPKEGIPGAGDQRIYAGIIDAFATEVTHQFVPYQAEE